MLSRQETGSMLRGSSEMQLMVPSTQLVLIGLRTLSAKKITSTCYANAERKFNLDSRRSTPRQLSKGRLKMRCQIAQEDKTHLPPPPSQYGVSRPSQGQFQGNSTNPSQIPPADSDEVIPRDGQEVRQGTADRQLHVGVRLEDR